MVELDILEEEPEPEGHCDDSDEVPADAILPVSRIYHIFIHPLSLHVICLSPRRL
jgi:hypothetical protein